MTFADLGGLIRAARLAQRKSLRALAEESGLSYSFLSKMENNKLRAEEWPSGDRLGVLCDVLVLRKDVVFAAAGKIPSNIKQALRDPDFMRMCLQWLDDSGHVCDCCGKNPCGCARNSDYFILSTPGCW